MSLNNSSEHRPDPAVSPVAIFDGHNDLAWEARRRLHYDPAPLGESVPSLQTDLPRLKRGGVAAQFWSVWVDPEGLTETQQVVATLEQIDFVRRLIDAHPDRLAFAATAADVRAAMDSARVASLMGVEGGAQIAGSLGVLRQFARLGVRYLTLTWMHTTDWADSATDRARHGGLSEFGRLVVTEMNRIGMLVDLSHVAPATMRDALQVTTRPAIASHSGALAICNHPRNVPDDVIAEIGAQGGVVMATFVPSFVSQARRDWFEGGKQGEPPRVGVSEVADHFDHIRDVAGVEAVGVGGDYDGMDNTPDGLEDVASYPALFDELRSRGWSHRDLEAAAHRNVLRVLEASDSDYRAFLDGSAPSPEAAALAPASHPNESDAS